MRHLRAQAVDLTSKTRPRLELIDYLRFGAALSVVCFHWLYNAVRNGNLESFSMTAAGAVAAYGLFGVHLFFLISGFVISNSAQQGWAGKFAAGRAVRLYPAYLVAMLLTGILSLWLAKDSLRTTPQQVLANITMWPRVFGHADVDGVYWTLHVETIFYALIAGILFLGCSHHLDRFFPAWAFAMLAVEILQPALEGVPYLGGYYALFAGGAILATMKRIGVGYYQLAGLTASLASALIFANHQIPLISRMQRFDYSFAVIAGLHLAFYGLIAAVLLPRIARMRLALSRQLGALTYPVYLLHCGLGYIVLNRLHPAIPQWLAYAVGLVAVVSLAWLVHLAIEVRAAKMTKRIARRAVGRPVDRLQAYLGLAPALPGLLQRQSQPAVTALQRVWAWIVIRRMPRCGYLNCRALTDGDRFCNETCALAHQDLWAI